MTKAKNEYRIEGNVVYVKLTRGQEAIVDVADFPLVAKHRWYALFVKTMRHYYAVTSVVKADGKKTTLLMHRLVNRTPEGMQTDHINRDTLDNRRENLRKATNSENKCNTTKPRNNTSGFKGVSWDKRRKKWTAYIKINGKSMNLGRFSNPESAARAYDKAALDRHGEFASTNFSTRD